MNRHKSTNTKGSMEQLKSGTYMGFMNVFSIIRMVLELQK